MRPYRIYRRSQYRAYAAFALLVISLLFFVWEIYITSSAGQPIEEIYDHYTLVTCHIGQMPVGELVVDGIRSLFIHLGFLQFATNMLFLWVFAPSVEEFLGHKRFLLFFILAGFGGHLASILFSGGNCLTLVGPNGALAGVLAAFLFLYPARRVDVVFPPMDRVFNVPAVIAILFYFAAVIFMSEGGPLSGQVAPFWDELGGFVTGGLMIFAFTLFKPAPKADPLEYLDED